MTPSEMQRALDAMDDASFASFKAAFGGSYSTRREYVDDFVNDPKHERRLAQLLDLQTEDEKLVQAAQRSAAAAEKAAEASLQSAKSSDSSANSARWSMIWAGLILAATIVGIGLATYARR